MLCLLFLDSFNSFVLPRDAPQHVSQQAPEKERRAVFVKHIVRQLSITHRHFLAFCCGPNGWLPATEFWISDRSFSLVFIVASHKRME
jgi:hypothetical protein